MANRPSRLEVSIPVQSYDGLYYGRYPLGKPAPASAPPLLVGIDTPSGPTAGGENGKGSYVRVYGWNLGAWSDWLSGVNQLTIGGVPVDNIRCLQPCPGRVGTDLGLWYIAAQVGAMTGLTPGTAYPVSVSVQGVSPVNPTSGAFFLDLMGEAISWTPNPGRIIFVDPVSGVNPPVGTVPDGVTYGSFSSPVKDLQGYDNGSGAFYGALTCQNVITGSCSPSNTLPPGSHVVLFDTAVYTKYLTNTNFGSYPWARLFELTGTLPTGALNSGYLVITGYPGPALGNSPDQPTFVGAGTSGGGIMGSDGARAWLANSFNPSGYGKCVVISGLWITANPLTQQTDGAPINLQAGADYWRIFGCDLQWKLTSVQGLSGGILVTGQHIRIRCNNIHDIWTSTTAGGSESQSNHGVYVGAGGSANGANNAQDVDIAHNVISNITNVNGVSSPYGGSGVQFHTGSPDGGKLYQNCRVRSNIIDTVIKNGVNMVQGSQTIDVYLNLIKDSMQYPIYVGTSQTTGDLIRITNNTIVGCNYGNRWGYGGSYTFVHNNGTGLPANSIVVQNNVLYQVPGATAYNWTDDNSGNAIQPLNNCYYDDSGHLLSKPAADSTGFYLSPKFTIQPPPEPPGGATNFTPASGSPLPNRGTTPPNIGFPPWDLLGRKMPQGTNTRIAVGCLERPGG